MKYFVVLSVALACVAAAPATLDESTAPILRSEYEISPEGAFQYLYETANGIYAQAQGNLKAVPGENNAVEIQGGYKYTAPDGTPVETTYVADENGFHPQGSHLPVPPPIPKAIQDSLAYIAAVYRGNPEAYLA